MNTYDAIAAHYEADFGAYQADVPFYLEMARRTGAPVLDAMCGTGRTLLPLAQQQHIPLTGVDSSQPMLAIAQRKLEHAGLLDGVTLCQGDLRTVTLPAASFALAFVAVNSFMHLERTGDQLAALATLHHALRPDGLLLLDLFNPDPLRLAQEDNRLVFEHAYDLDGQRVQKFVAADSDPATQTSYLTYIFDEMDSAGHITRRTLSFSLRWLYRYELEHLLYRAGFRLRALYGSYDLDDYTSSSERMIAVAVPARHEPRPA